MLLAPHARGNTFICVCVCVCVFVCVKSRNTVFEYSELGSYIPVRMNKAYYANL
uniref:Uncharacterized protein n=1 Tax=Anguilla anguilla TaxID=7936 RepID=A0A0E9R2F5_ANGAN